MVCCATRGEAGECTPGFDLAGRDLAEVREQELRAAADLLGVARVVVLDHHDSGMEGDTGPGTLVAAPTEALAAEIRPTDYLRRVHPPWDGGPLESDLFG